MDQYDAEQANGATTSKSRRAMNARQDAELSAPAQTASASASVDRTQTGATKPMAYGDAERAADSSEKRGTPGRAPRLDTMDIKSLRARAWTLATRLAQRHALSEFIKPLSGQGLGFVLTDVPEPALVDQLDEDALAQVSMVWWHLAAASEMTVAPLEHLLPVLDEGSVLRRALEEQDAGLLFSSVWTLDPGHMGFRLWRRLDARSWQDLVDLMETYRALHSFAAQAGEGLWQ
jgi:hypothetical protein